ncbi:conjugative transposon protein TraN [Dyadobacter psychrophilus]|nr:conjugative transposon protein TraN [Dyadobacter psychrophilus]
MSVIEPLPLEITLHKTTNLIFPFEIKSVDKGSRDILAQKTKGVANILQLKAAKADFVQTNLTVVCAEGKLYSFTVNYAPEPERLNIEFAAKKAHPDAYFENGINQAEIQQLSESILAQRNQLKGPSDKHHKVQIELNGIYVHNDMIFYRLEMENRSPIRYQIQDIRFFIRDREPAKRSAVQQTETKPFYVHGDTAMIKGESKHIFIFALPKFTLEDKKYMAVQMMEKNGGRHMLLKVNNRTITKAKPISGQSI